MEKLYKTYRNCKAKQGNEVIVLVRDNEYACYHTFESDAKKSQEITGVLLYLCTEKHILTTTFDYSNLDTYLQKVISRGYRVVICG